MAAAVAAAAFLLLLLTAHADGFWCSSCDASLVIRGAAGIEVLEAPILTTPDESGVPGRGVPDETGGGGGLVWAILILLLLACLCFAYCYCKKKGGKSGGAAGTWGEAHTPPPPPGAGAKPLPAGWNAIVDPNSGREYYHNAVTGAVTWTAPES